MIIYNVTSHIATPIISNWLQWMKDEHIPAIMQTGCFEQYQWVELLETDESEGKTYAIQFYAPSITQVKRFKSEFEQLLQEKIQLKWGQQMLSFSTLMQVVH
jgi:hypothetical protein